MLASRKLPSAAKIILPVFIAAFFSVSCTGERDERAGLPTTGGARSAVPASVKPAAIKTEKGDPASGRDIYEKHCHYCHGMTGRGDGPVGLALTPHPVNFVDDAKLMQKSDEALFSSITEGVRKDIGGESMFMPRWKEILSEKERWDVLAYVRKLSEDGGKKNK